MEALPLPIVSAGFGEGHNAAARAVVESFNRLYPGQYRAEFKDLFLNAFGEEKFRKQRELYLNTANRWPRLWGLAYHALDRLPLVQAALPFLGRVAQKYRETVYTTPTPLVVSTYPLYGHFHERLWRQKDIRRPRIITIITDSISVNRAWHRAFSDWYIAPNQATADILIRQGVPASRVRALGFPVSSRLRHSQKKLQSTRPKVLLMLNPARPDAVALARAISGLAIELTVTVGKDAQFYQEVVRAVEGRAHVIGWTDRLPELILESDLVLTKAGGATTHECIAAGVPMIFTQVIPGQEAGNARLVVEGGAGMYGLTTDAAYQAVAFAFKDDWAVWRAWRKAISALGDPLGADRVAELMQSEIQLFGERHSTIR